MRAAHCKHHALSGATLAAIANTRYVITNKPTHHPPSIPLGVIYALIKSFKLPVRILRSLNTSRAALNLNVKVSCLWYASSLLIKAN